ncbi:MAG: ABC transporter substrate-binding protein [Magnetococcus sp. DMHC-1]|nr:ABC transporter substrate-binding protein [Magnetococcales bacterium]
MAGSGFVTSLMLLAFSCLSWIDVAWADDPPLPKIVVSVVGPRNLSYLPFDLIPKIGADREEGISVELQHAGGGGVVLKQLLSRNSEFAAVGFTALMSMKTKDHNSKVVAVAAVADTPLFVLIVRSELQNQVKRIADLKGRVVGVHSSSVNAKTAAHQLLELMLRSDGLETDDVRIISSGQSWEERTNMLKYARMDAVISEEPFASSMLAAGKVFFLASLADEKTTGLIPGAHFLHTSLTTRSDVIANEPDKVKRMVRALGRSLTWIASHTPDELVAQLQILDPRERDMLRLCLQKYPRLFSKDGQFKKEQIDDTRKFFSNANPHEPLVNIENLIDGRWVGIKDAR